MTTIDDFPFDEILEKSSTGKELLDNSFDVASLVVVAEAITKYCALSKFTVYIDENTVSEAEAICNTIIAILKDKALENYKYDESLSELDMVKAIYEDCDKDTYLASALVEHKNGGSIMIDSGTKIDSDGLPYMAFYASYLDKNNAKTIIEEMR